MSNILVTRSSMPSFEEYCEEIKEIWNSHWLTNMGVKHKELQKELENYLGISHVVLYTNGHLALENAIAALNLPKGGEVITTPFTFASTTHAIVRNGLIPVFCDIKEDDYTIDTQKLENLITDNTVAIVPVHVYGNICDVEEIDRISKKYGLKVIYDAAHAFAVKYKGESSACFGDASMFSFHATKVFNTIEGGCVCFKDDSWIQLLNDMKNFGIHGPESVQFVGANAKMNEFQAAMGICISPMEVDASRHSTGLVTADAMAKVFNSKIMAKVAIIGGMCGIITSWNSFLIGGSRALFALAESYMIPHCFSKLHPKYNTPVLSLLLIGVLSVISPFFGKSMLVWISNSASFACCIAYCMVSISFLVLRKKMANEPRPYKVKHFKFVGVMAIFMAGFMVLVYIFPWFGCNLVKQEWIIIGGWGTLGIIFSAICKMVYKDKYGVML